jgi:hypothetical protein
MWRPAVPVPVPAGRGLQPMATTIERLTNLRRSS